MIEQFLFYVAQRLRNENDLSDITWAMCQTSKAFRTLFIKFFFPEESFDEVDLQREVADDDCRPDFLFYSQGKTFLIECKIGDRNHHFDQYIKHYGIPKEQLGYITNYPLIQDGFRLHTWAEFYNSVEKNIPMEEETLWKGYLQYLKSVCNINIFRTPMNLDGMFSLYIFYKLLDDVFTFNTNDFSTQLYDSKRDTNSGGNWLATPRDGVMGKYFEVNFKKNEFKTTWGWMGVYFDREHPVICIGFNDKEGWGWPVYEWLQKSFRRIDAGQYSSKPYSEVDGIWFDFTGVDLFNQSDLDTQKKILSSFFSEVITTIINSFRTDSCK